MRRSHELRTRLRALRVAALLLPTGALVVCDLARRAAHLAHLDPLHVAGYVGSIGVSAVVWSSLLYMAGWRRSVVGALASALFFAAYGLSTGAQAAFFAKYNLYASVDSMLDSESVAWSLVGSLPIAEPRLFGFVLVGLVTAGLMVGLARAVVRPRRVPKIARPLLFVPFGVVVAVMPVSYRTVQSTSPELIYFHGIATLVRHTVAPPYEHLVRAQRRRPMPLPPLGRRAEPARNLVFIIQEALRADVSCNIPVAHCGAATRATNDATPNRMPLLEMRSNASSTHLSVQVMWSGLSPTATREQMETAPFVFELARAAGYDIAYWTSQNLVFGNYRMALQGIPFSHFSSGTELDPKADMIAGASDAELSDRVIAEIGELREPFFAVIQYANVHRPRVFDPHHAPFQPTDSEDHLKKDPGQKNFYRNAVYLSDRAVARLVEHVHQAPFGPRTAMVYTSDHAEGWFEHHQDNDHSGSVFEEEIHVPAWIDAPPGVLTEAEEQAVRSKRTTYLWHVDVAPTLLDLLGLWGTPGLERFQKTMMGHPITRPEATTEPVPLSNVSWVWEYLVPNWGLMQGSLKVHALEDDKAWRCYDVAQDPTEENDLGLAEPRCAALARAAFRTFHMLPKQLGRLRRRPAWGDGGR